MFSERAIETTEALEISLAKPPSEKEQVLALGVEKYSSVMWSFWCGKSVVEPILSLIL